MTGIKLKLGDSVEITTMFEFQIDQIRHAVASMRNVRFKMERESFDFGNQIAYSLTMWIATLPERGVLVIEQPATWVQHLKQTLFRRHHRLFGWLVRRWPVKMKTDRYEAVDYLPAVVLPQDMSEGRFQVWWHK